MDSARLDASLQKPAEEALGYLNFASGSSDPRFLANLNLLYASQLGRAAAPPWHGLRLLLLEAVEQFRGSREGFRQLDQATAVITLVFDEMLPAYRQHHRDLLFHQTDDDLFTPLFIGRVCEAVLQQGPPWTESPRIVSGALRVLNNFIGYRPVAVLQTEQKIQPYAHEWVCPVPLYVRGAGVGAGKYQALIERALGLLDETDADLLFEAHFDPQSLDELAFDPRAYDFDHPNNRRPNYLFGQWDLGRLDLGGRSRRFVVQQAALDMMLERVQEDGKSAAARKNLLFEAAAVLAGTMLMGSGVSGTRPDAHDSSVTLAGLVQRIAVYRDAFYERLFKKLKGSHAEILRNEAIELHQPMGGARQDFNQRVARRRAAQSQDVNLSRLYVRIGNPQAALQQVAQVPAASARMLCEVHCRILAARRALDEGKLASTAEQLPQIEDLIRRGIECGAMVDPWNILGFGGQYSLFAAAENSMPDHRVDELIDVLTEVFSLYTELMTEAAARGESSIQRAATTGLEGLAQWWDKYAADEISGVDGISGRETWESARHVAQALGTWHLAGTAAGDIAFWREHAEQFRSAKSYALVVEALIDQRDLVAAMALLMQWLSQHQEMDLVEEDHAFFDLAILWMEELWRPVGSGREESQREGIPALDRWSLSRKFLDYLEANAEDLWQAPRFELGQSATTGGDAEEFDEEEDEDDTFGAAYEGVTFRDSTADGIEGEIFDTGQAPTDFELVLESERVSGRLLFLGMLAELWRLAAVTARSVGNGDAAKKDTLAAWLQQAQTNRSRLNELLLSVHRYRIPRPRGTYESLVEYDRRRSVKESLLEQIIGTYVETSDAALMIQASMDEKPSPRENLPWERVAAATLGAMTGGDVDEVRLWWAALGPRLLELPLLYVALSRGGHPKRIAESRGVQRVVKRLLYGLPRLGMIRETDELIRLVHHMEIVHPVGPGGVTEFDDIFDIACRGICRCLTVSSSRWRKRRAAGHPDEQLIELLETAMETLLERWLDHSAGMRLTVAESLQDSNRFGALKRFIERYGHDIFTQQFMQLGNLRAILHQGVESWLYSLAEEPSTEFAATLFADLDTELPREKAVRLLSLILESVVDYYQHYVDYNTTTTQSDRGEMLYTLLDFLRVLASYDRVAWNLRPVVIAHDVLVRAGRTDAADLWRAAIAARTAETAESHLKRLHRLTRRYGMRLAGVAERVGERFIGPMEVDRLRAMVRPAMDDARNPAPAEAFGRLQAEIEQLKREPTSAAIEVPLWLSALEDEISRVENEESSAGLADEWHFPVPEIPLGLTAARRELKAMSR